MIFANFAYLPVSGCKYRNYLCNNKLFFALFYAIQRNFIENNNL